MKFQLPISTRVFFFAISCLLLSCAPQENSFDLLIKNALIYDGSGSTPYEGSVGVNADTIAAIGTLKNANGLKEIDAKGMAISPGFINMLSWATESLIADGRGQSDLRQGVTLEVMGEGWSMGPINEKMKQQNIDAQGDFKYDIKWTTLDEYLSYLEEKGVSLNVASFFGATTARIHEIGYENRPPTKEELERMKALARKAMEDGALGIGSSLIYAPAFYASTDELVALCEVAAEYDGLYVTHMRSEGNRIFDAIDETIEIAQKSGIRAEIYHLKMSGEKNWNKLDQVIGKLETARESGIDINTNMYNYIAGATGLDASMPPWVQEGGYKEWARRLKDPAIRKKVAAEMKIDTDEWENLYASAGSADKLILVGFKNDELKKYTGKNLAEVAAMRGTTPEETAMDLVIEDGSRVGTVYFLMSEENVQRQIKMPNMTFGSDAAAISNEGFFLKSNPHPRTYGNFSRLLGKYVREEKVITLEEAIKRLTSMSAERLRIKNRGSLKPGYFADLVLFDPNTIGDNSTFENPHQYSQGVHHVFVNGGHVLEDGEPTGVFSGRVVRGPGAQ